MGLQVAAPKPVNFALESLSKFDREIMNEVN